MRNSFILKNIILPFVVFICGFAVMILEICASRIMAPIVGSSGYIWTIIIGVILTSLSLGYWIGGKLSDKKPHARILAVIVIVSGLFILLTGLYGKFAATTIKSFVTGYYLSTFLISIKLFFFTNILLGMVSPFAIRLKLEQNDQDGSSIGLLYATSTLGSLLGTFSAGYLLIPRFPVSSIITTTGTCLLIAGLLLYFATPSIKVRANVA